MLITGKIHLILLLFIGSFLTPPDEQAHSLLQPPVLTTQNPIATYYQDTDAYPAWTDEVRWDRLIDMSTYTNGNNDFEKFENARDELHAQGGGVLYYPAGVYSFEDMPKDDPQGRGLMLKRGVVLLGETPPTNQTATNAELELSTKFKFSYEARSTDEIFGGGDVPHPWNIVGITPGEGEQLKDIDNVGIAWIELEGATVYFGPQMTWGSTYASSGAWYSGRASTGIWKDRQPDGTHPIDPFAGISGTQEYLGAGQNRFVFGCIIKDAVVANPKIIDYSQGGDFSYHMYKFGARIGLYGSNVFVANNVLPKSDKNFVYQHTTAITQQGRCNQVFGTRESVLLFDYGKSTGIDINKTYLNVCVNKNEGYFEENIVVKDNYIYNHGAKGVDLSGKWMIIQNNHNERDYLQEGDDVYFLFGSDEWELTQDGYFESVPGGNGCLSDNLSRAFDLAGEALWIDHNSWNNLGSNPGNDGESILSQRHGGTDIHSWTVTRNTHLDSYNYSNTGYLSGFDVHNQGMLVAWNDTRGTVGNLKAGNLFDCAFIPNAAEAFKLDYYPSQRDMINQCPEGPIQAPAQVDITWPTDSSFVEISWQDTTDNEIGYRVDKREVGSETWSTVTYRPRQSIGHSRNKAQWKDFLAPLAKTYEYRVVAINCEEDLAGASPWINAKSVNVVSSTSAFKELQGVTLFPNPVKDRMLLDWPVIKGSPAANISISSISGKLVRQLEVRASGQTSIDLKSLTAGTYFCTVTVGQQRTTLKFIKK